MAKEKLGLMVDLETWGVREDCVIRQIAIKPFKWDGLQDELSVVFYPNEIEQSNTGRTKDTSTIKWWEGQNIEVNSNIMKAQRDRSLPCADVAQSIMYYVNYFKRKYEVSFVARGATTFDYPILDNFCKQYGAGPLGIAFYRIYDLRSLTSILKCLTGHDFTEKKDGASHDAMYDCTEQINQLLRVRDVIKL